MLVALYRRPDGLGAVCNRCRVLEIRAACNNTIPVSKTLQDVSDKTILPDYNTEVDNINPSSSVIRHLVGYVISLHAELSPVNSVQLCLRSARRRPAYITWCLPLLTAAAAQRAPCHTSQSGIDRNDRNFIVRYCRYLLPISWLTAPRETCLLIAARINTQRY